MAQINPWAKQIHPCFAPTGTLEKAELKWYGDARSCPDMKKTNER